MSRYGDAGLVGVQGWGGDVKGVVGSRVGGYQWCGPRVVDGWVGMGWWSQWMDFKLLFSTA